jgi:hypothetical protein
LIDKISWGCPIWSNWEFAKSIIGAMLQGILKGGVSLYG